MKIQAIGHIECSVCGHHDAEVKPDKNGHAFIFCPDCAAQTFTRNEYRDRHLRRRMRPVTVTVTEQDEKPAAAPAIPPVTVPKPAAAVPPPAPAPAAATTKKPVSWLQPLLAVGGNNAT